MTSPSFVVTGCGRSGSLYMARVLQQAGVRVGHEAAFDPPRVRPELLASQGEVSWAAAGHFDRLPARTLVVHQLRNPLAVIASYVEMGFFDDLPVYSAKNDLVRPVLRAIRRLTGRAAPSSFLDHQRFARALVPEAWEHSESVGRGARFWVAWNRRVERGAIEHSLPYHRLRIEDLDDAALNELLALLGRPQATKQALAAVPTTTNRKRNPTALTWEDVPRDERRALREVAATYGY